jgi:hypothetical protein
VEPRKIGMLYFPQFNQYVVGFANPFYPQKYAQKIRVGFDALLQVLSGILAEFDISSIFCESFGFD